MRYFLDFVDVGGNVRAAQHGMEFADLRAAKVAARQILIEIGRDTVVTFSTTLEVRISRRVDGPIVASVSLELHPGPKAA